MCQRYPNKDYIAATLSRPVIHLLHSYSFTLWTDRNAFIYGANAKEASAKHIQTLVTAITSSAFQHQVSIPINERGHLFGIPLIQRIKQTPSLMESWLAIYRAGQA